MTRSYLTLLTIAALSSTLCSCGSFRADVTNPTVAQMDALDVQWGLTPRRPKGGARNNNNAQPAPAPAPTAVAPAPAAVDPSVIQSLR